MSAVTDMESRTRSPSSSRNEDHPLYEQWKAEASFRAMVGTFISFEAWLLEREQAPKIYRGEICRRCKRKLRPKDKLYRARFQSGVQLMCTRCWTDWASSSSPNMSLYGHTWSDPETLPCAGCGRLIVGYFRKRWVDGDYVPIVTCCERCASRRQVNRRKARRAADRAELVCVTCGVRVLKVRTPSRNDARYCSNACRQKAYRIRRAGKR